MAQNPPTGLTGEHLERPDARDAHGTSATTTAATLIVERGRDPEGLEVVTAASTTRTGRLSAVHPERGNEGGWDGRRRGQGLDD